MKQYDLIKDKLEGNEYIIWEGKPNYKRIFAFKDILIIPITVPLFLFFLILIIPDAAHDLGLASLAEYSNRLNGFRWLVLPFLIATFYLSIGRFFSTMNRLKTTEYYLTNKRIFVYSNAFFKQVHIYERTYNSLKRFNYPTIGGKAILSEIPYLNEGKPSVYRNVYGGMDIHYRWYLPTKSTQGSTSIVNIEDTELILDIITEMG